jgi:hypothetical protein
VSINRSAWIFPILHQVNRLSDQLPGFVSKQLLLPTGRLDVGC